MRIVQIVPFIGRGKGIAGVAWQLDRALRAAGTTTETFTYNVARGRRRPQRHSRHPVIARMQRAWRVIWFSTFGTRQARRYLAERPDAISICHSEVLAGDIYVSHGVESIAVRTRRRGWWRLLANPVRLFTYLRERHRYRSRIHRVIVALSDTERDTLLASYRKVVPPVVVIPNGVDLTAFHPPTADERAAARAGFRLPDEARVALLVGHDLIRKGSLVAVDALVHAPSILLLIVGGDEESIAATRARAEEAGVAPRVLFMGRQSDIPLMMAASDVFFFPSRYEANALVILEALACGLPVICTPVGYAPEIIVDGENGWLVPADPVALGRRLEAFAADEPQGLRERARASVADHGWDAVAQRYVELADRLRAGGEVRA